MARNFKNLLKKDCYEAFIETKKMNGKVLLGVTESILAQFNSLFVFFLIQQ